MYFTHARCDHASGYRAGILTPGKVYKVVGYVWPSNKMIIIDNSGVEREVFNYRFTWSDENGNPI